MNKYSRGGAARGGGDGECKSECEVLQRRCTCDSECEG